MEALPLAALMLGGLDVSAAVILNFTGDFQHRAIEYRCGETEDSIRVQYINAAPNYLAIVPVAGQNLVFATVLSASGARYAAGEYEWWAARGEATLTNLQTPDAEPLTCVEVGNDIP